MGDEDTQQKKCKVIKIENFSSCFPINKIEKNVLLIWFALFCCFILLSLYRLPSFILHNFQFLLFLLVSFLLIFFFVSWIHFRIYSLAWTNNRCEFQQNNTIKIHHATVDILLCMEQNIVITNKNNSWTSSSGPWSSNANNFSAINAHTHTHITQNQLHNIFLQNVIYLFA